MKQLFPRHWTSAVRTVISERWETVRGPRALGQSLTAARQRREPANWGDGADRLGRLGQPELQVREPERGQLHRNSRDPQGLSLKYAAECWLASACNGNQPKPGKKLPQNNTKNTPGNPSRAGNSTCFYQPNWKNSWFLGLLEYSEGSCFRTTNRDLLYRPGNSASCPMAGRWEASLGRMDTHVYTAEDLRCPPKTITMLISYTPIQSKFKKKKTLRIKTKGLVLVVWKS